MRAKLFGAAVLLLAATQQPSANEFTAYSVQVTGTVTQYTGAFSSHQPGDTFTATYDFSTTAGGLDHEISGQRWGTSAAGCQCSGELDGALTGMSFSLNGTVGVNIGIFTSASFATDRLIWNDGLITVIQTGFRSFSFSQSNNDSFFQAGNCDTSTCGNVSISSITSGCFGGCDIAGVPGPIAGAGLPGLMFVGGSLLAWWRKRRNAALTA